MNIKVIPTDGFTKELKRLSKKHPGLLSDIAELSKELKVNPIKGADLGQNVYKIRMAVSGTNKGKSGGARVITFVVLVRETVFLAEIYLKNENDTVDADRVIHRLQNEGLI
ncbi:type II toxin-antitoxin system RelE/ParE family toxin [Mucilaginibacter sp.]|uniref:type II toxin-antitoxin system RelE/ParE family toxin n=1 Tax=Mucilaginibacter sp. TaxID=1882438 RepID=UPI00283EE9C4|nr:type II toxin-antitoxin system RelE/ParE family toxin [Mucilaginibacter sp.]MDR3694759.1 type II toxin-antitoxin system RelE/ParE family toxin [Mucilaginibacter sp.]